MSADDLIIIFILIRVVCHAEQCVYTTQTSIACTQVQNSPSDISEIAEKLLLNQTQTYIIRINNKNCTVLREYLLENKSVSFLSLIHNSIELIEGQPFDRIKDMTSLDLSDNRLSWFRSSVKLTNLSVLKLSNNNIRSLDVNTFNEFKRLSQISLTDNPIESIGPGVFNLPTLSVLNLNGNNLKECVNNTFVSLTKLATLWISSNNIQYIHPGCFNGLGLVANFKIKSNLLKNAANNDSAPKLSQLRWVSSIDMTSNSLTAISSEWFKGLKNLQTLILTSNFIEKIDTNVWQDCVFLASLNLKSNQLRTLTPYMFKYAVNLGKIFLNENKIQIIEKNAFTGLEKSLTFLNLTDNRLEYLKSYYFSGLKKLDTLGIKKNMISFIEVNTFKDLTSLKSLDLDRNSLFEIEPGVLSSLLLLETLSLRFNCLKSMHVFTNLTKLKSLDLGSNRITRIDLGYLLENSPKLSKLVLADNVFDDRVLYVSQVKINSLDISRTNLEVIKIDKSMSSLSSFDISDSPFLKNISGLEYTSLTSFYLRNISSSLLESIDMDHFIPDLAELDISGNKLNRVYDSFFEMNNMKNLNLSNTLQVESVSDIFTWSSTMIRIDLSGNGLSRVSINQKSSFLGYLNLARNRISQLDDIGSSEYLQDLDLSYNQLTMLKRKWFQGFPYLCYLYLSNNQIEYIEPDSFTMETFSYLDLNNNRLKHFLYVYFSQDLTNSINLNSIKLFNNSLKSFDFTGLSVLYEVRSSNNNLTYRDINSFRYSSLDMSILFLDYNNLTFIEKEFFSKALSMEILNISHNQITYIEPGSFSSLKLLKQLDLSYNQISELSSTIFNGVSALTFIDLSHNRLKTIQSDLFKGLNKLSYLGLESNLIKVNEDFSFKDVNRLVRLSIDANSAHLPFSNLTLVGLEAISFITVSAEYFNSRQNLIAVKESLLSNSGRFVMSRSYSSQVKIDYYRAISINYRQLPILYTYRECFNIMYLARNGIQLNVNTEEGVELLVDQCSFIIGKVFVQDLY